MQITDTGTLYSPSDLVAFLGCRHRTALDLAALTDASLEPDSDDELNEILQRLGDEHEHRYLQELKDAGRLIVEIDTGADKASQISDTLDALRSGAEVIFQATLLHEDIYGRADFLIRIEEPSSLGTFSYEIVDTKLARNPNPKFLVQLSAYAQAVEAIQGRLPENVHIVLGDGRPESYRTFEFYSYYRNALSQFRAFVSQSPVESSPEPCTACGFCPWQSRCEAHWQAEDHLSRVANISRNQIQRLRAAGIPTVADLASSPADTEVPKIPSETFTRLRHQARLQEAEHKDGKPRFECLPLDDDGLRGFHRLPAPATGDLFFDIEGDPLYPDGLEYLFGVGWHDREKFRYRAFWAHNHAEEKSALEALIDLFTDHLAAHSDAHIYHYAAYEVSALKRLMSRYGTRENQVDNLLRGQKFVDLYRVVREGIRVSRPSYSIKELEVFYMNERGAEVAGGAESIVFYEQWRANRDPSKLEEIRRYNEEDCESTLLLRDWLIGQRPKGVPWFASISEPDGTDEQPRAAARLAREEALRVFEQQLVATADAMERPFRQTLFHLLDFHRREAKSEWWAMFERATATQEELVEDNECLGGLTVHPTIPDEPVKRSVVRTYTFPEQQSKLRAGDRCQFPVTLESAGVIDELDPDRRIVRIRRAQSRGAYPDRTALIPGGPYDTSIIVGAIDSYAESIVDGDGRFAALTSLLKRETPRISGAVSGAPLIDPTGDIIKETARVVSGLEDSYVFIQGPPGSGKTFTASHVIARLIENGKSVAVSSNSHKAIINLLNAVEKRASERGLRFHGQKKSNRDDPESQVGGSCIKDVFSNGDIDLSANLIAGTAWLLCRPEFCNQFDYLFVDEAGQISLANIVGMGTCARNVILIGDHMQLAQPAKGIHPGDSGKSVLEYLLKEHPTIPPDRGIFLPTSWRMHEDVCQFISQAVYEGRLNPEEKNQNQKLILGQSSHSALKPTGITYAPVEHVGCSQESAEEATVISGLLGSLLQQRYVDRDGIEHTMELDDILVVSPYNLQVNLLKRHLPAGARVGTVDKFQGQEAIVSIVSMATSSDDDVPRGVEFLLSKNRLNVAISRARCLSIFVASPKLTDIPCSTIDQVRLVNMLCYLRDYASST